MNFQIGMDSKAQIKDFQSVNKQLINSFILTLPHIRIFLIQINILMELLILIHFLTSFIYLYTKLMIKKRTIYIAFTVFRYN